jgi:hypothetical protein
MQATVLVSVAAIAPVLMMVARVLLLSVRM